MQKLAPALLEDSALFSQAAFVAEVENAAGGDSLRVWSEGALAESFSLANSGALRATPSYW